MKVIGINYSNIHSTIDKQKVADSNLSRCKTFFPTRLAAAAIIDSAMPEK